MNSVKKGLTNTTRIYIMLFISRNQKRRRSKQATTKETVQTKHSQKNTFIKASSAFLRFLRTILVDIMRGDVDYFEQKRIISTSYGSKTTVPKLQKKPNSKINSKINNQNRSIIHSHTNTNDTTNNTRTRWT